MQLNSEPMILRHLAQYVCEFRRRTIPPEVVHAASRCVVDWMAALIPGGVRAPATLLAAALDREVSHGTAILVPSGRRADPRAAALINGSAAHTIEFDDIFRDALYHPGAPTISAALAIAQDRRVTGDLFLRAVIAGYELSTRIGVVVQPKHYDFWHTTGTVGTFGAAAAAAVILDLDTASCAHALATSATLAAGLQQAFRSHSMSKPIHAGHAAETGLLAALAAEHGVTGALDVLEGPRGFGAAMSDGADFTRVLEHIDAFNIRHMTFKNYSACGHTFAAIDAVLDLASRFKVLAEDVHRMEIATYAKALEVAGNPHPQAAFEAQFSLPYCAAVALITGSVRLEAFSETRLKDPAVKALLARTQLSVDPEADAAYPRQRAAKVTIITLDGRRLSAQVHTRRGDPDNPLSDEELQEKYMELVVPLLGASAARELLQSLWRIESLADIAALPLPDAITPAMTRSDDSSRCRN